MPLIARPVCVLTDFFISDKIMKYLYAIIFLLFCSLPAIAEDIKESMCYGTTDKGRIENAWKLSVAGRNFSAYSSIGATLGRNYVHSKVYKTAIDAYKDLEEKKPGKTFVYGETGWRHGGRFRPHKSHQNGLSVDFFVPVVDATGKPATLPTGPFNKFGYAIEFDARGKYQDYSIDFEIMAAHLFALKRAADKHGIGIWRVIFDNDFQKLLFKTSRGKELQSLMTFSTKKPWVRHDEHYHVDFVVPCREFR